jgi:hypothetical protein
MKIIFLLHTNISTSVTSISDSLVMYWVTMHWVSVSPLTTGTLIAVYLVTLSPNMSQTIQHQTVGSLLNTELYSILSEVIIANCEVLSDTYLVRMKKTMENLSQDTHPLGEIWIQNLLNINRPQHSITQYCEWEELVMLITVCCLQCWLQKLH